MRGGEWLSNEQLGYTVADNVLPRSVPRGGEAPARTIASSVQTTRHREAPSTYRWPSALV